MSATHATTARWIRTRINWTRTSTASATCATRTAGVIYVLFNEERVDRMEQHDPVRGLEFLPRRPRRAAGKRESTRKPTNPLAIRHCGFTITSFNELMTPPAGKVVFYLISGSIGTTEYTLGRKSGGNLRQNTNPCLGGPEQLLCEETGGFWDIGSCWHYVCGLPPDCDAIIPGCNCGLGRNFEMGVGCVVDPACP